MFKYVVIPIFFAAVNAGLLGAPALSPLAYSTPFVAAPVAVKTAVPIATSYQNTYKVSAPVAAVATPVFKAAPLIASPVVSSVVAAPVLKAAPLIASPLALGHFGLH